MSEIVTLAEAKAELGIGDTTDDTSLQRLLDGLQARFEELTNRRFARATVTEVHDGGTRCLYVQRRPIETLTTLIVDPAREFDAADALTVGDDYWIDAANGRIYYQGGIWPVGVAIIQAVYTGGYVAAGTTPSSGQTAMPEALRRALFMQAQFEWRNRTTLGASSMSAQGINVQIAPAKLLPEVEDILGSFMRF